jgi:hypothetical protein
MSKIAPAGFYEARGALLRLGVAAVVPFQWGARNRLTTSRLDQVPGVDRSPSCAQMKGVSYPCPTHWGVIGHGDGDGKEPPIKARQERL